MKKQVNYKSVNNTKIDINSLYNKLREALATRNSLEEKQRNLWSIIKRSKKDLNFEMNKIDIKIGENTHKINMIISKLSHYNKTHKAMSMAKDYLNKEILRCEKIISKNKNTIYEVEHGYSMLISSRGYEHTNTFTLRNYVFKKEEQLLRMKKWLKAIEKYAKA